MLSAMFRPRFRFWKDALKGGGQRLVWIVGLVSLITGVTVATICAVVFKFSPWLVVSILLATVLLTFAEGAYRVYARADEARSEADKARERAEAEPKQRLSIDRNIISGGGPGSTGISVNLQPPGLPPAEPVLPPDVVDDAVDRAGELEQGDDEEQSQS